MYFPETVSSMNIQKNRSSRGGGNTLWIACMGVLAWGLSNPVWAEIADARSISKSLSTPLNHAAATPAQAPVNTDDDEEGAFKSMAIPVREECEPARPAAFSNARIQDESQFRNLVDRPVAKIDLTVEFEFGKAELTASGRLQLAQVVMALNTGPLTQALFAILGHTDKAGTAPANQQLSCERALAVKNYLIQNGVSAERLTTLGKGFRELRNKESPLAAENRRVEFRRLF